MATLLGNTFSTDEKVIVQANLKVLDQSSNRSSSNSTKRSSNSFSPQASLALNQRGSTAKSFQRLALNSLRDFWKKASLEANRWLFDKANDSTSLEVLTISHGVNTTCDGVSQETRKVSVLVHSQHRDEDPSHCQTPLEARQTQFVGDSQQLLRANQNDDHRRRCQACCQQVEEVENSVVNTTREARIQPCIFAKKCDARVHKLRVPAIRCEARI